MKTVSVRWEEVRSYTGLVQVPDDASPELITELCDQAVHPPAWPGNPGSPTRLLARQAGPAKILSVAWEDGNEFGGRIR